MSSSDNFRLSSREESVSIVPLFRHFPLLSEKIAWLSLTQTPSPVQKYPDFAKASASELWIKRDDLCGRGYGGNKPRKLEFLLADALAKKVQYVMTFGALGTNHGLATAFYAKALGLETSLILVKQPCSPNMCLNLRACHSLGAKLIAAGGDLGAVFHGAAEFLRIWWKGQGRLPYLIMPGGSSALGCVGFVNAAFELVKQIENGELPEPDLLYVPVGSNGTLSGLLVGARLAGLKTRIVGVKVSHYSMICAKGVASMANRCWRYLQKKDPSIPSGKIELSDFDFEDSYLGEGYAHPTDAALEAVRLMKEQKGIPLEFVYSGKAFAAVLDRLEKRGEKQNVLFWNTYNSLPFSDLFGHLPELSALPSRFHQYFK